MRPLVPRRLRRSAPALTTCVFAAVLAACGSTQPPKPQAPVASTVGPPMAEPPGPTAFNAAPGLTPAQRGARAETLLAEGQLGLARAEVDALLADAPQDPLGRSLYRQMNEDPRRLLSGEATSHTVAPGETLQELAERYLGDRNLFWALARYNGVPVPNALRPGQVLQIPRAPGRRPLVGAPHHAGAAEHAAAVKPASLGAGRDPQRAGRLRGEALEALNRGQADRAVGLLQQALQADPENPAVKRDLDRAQRIRSQLRGHR